MNKRSDSIFKATDKLIKGYKLKESRTSDIVKDAWKSAKSRKSKDVESLTNVESKDDSRKDTFQKDPEMTGEIAKQ